ncbi:MAG TPA: hypothetical protein VEQ41_04880 [Solirubrobacterales bacterium]|nr:hypothetical protein [Solirubrobacterales bacterium]
MDRGRKASRRWLAAALTVLVATAVAVAAALGAQTRTPLPVGNLDFTFGLRASPQAMPKRAYVPVTVDLLGAVETRDGTHPPALRELVLDVDEDVKLDAEGIPVCKPPPSRDARRARKACGPAIVGSGSAKVEFAFPGQTPSIAPSPVTVFNGGTRDGVTTLFVHAFVRVPVPAAVVTRVTVRRSGSGVHSVARVPVIAAGAGSLVDFRVRLGRDYAYEGEERSLLRARCPDGVFEVATSKAVFRNEAGVPGAPPTTMLKGVVLVPCVPKG